MTLTLNTLRRRPPTMPATRTGRYRLGTKLRLLGAGMAAGLWLLGVPATASASYSARAETRAFIEANQKRKEQREELQRQYDEEGRKLWKRFHAIDFPHKMREELKLNRADAGWYQIRKALEHYGGTELTDFDPFKAAYAALGAKLRPMVFELGFLPE